MLSTYQKPIHRLRRKSRLPCILLFHLISDRPESDHQFRMSTDVNRLITPWTLSNRRHDAMAPLGVTAEAHQNHKPDPCAPLSLILSFSLENIRRFCNEPPVSAEEVDQWAAERDQSG